MVNVKIYTTNACPFCKMAKYFLKKNNIKFEDIDVSNNEVLAREMVQTSGQMAIPVTVIDNKVIIGFDEEELKKALNL